MLGRGFLVHAIAFVIGAPRIPAVSPAQDSTASRAPFPASSDTTRRVSGLRSPLVAGVLGSAVPGAGLAYAGHWIDAGRTYLGTISGFGLGYFFVSAGPCLFAFYASKSCNPGDISPQHTLGIGLIASGAVLWARAAIDAVHLVKADNANKLPYRYRHTGSVRFEHAIFAPRTPDGSWAAGIHAAW
jgi:hypothetical protein